MADRIQSVGGALTISSRPRAGTTVLAQVPLIATGRVS
jgi:signal transduction histidine kinase